MPSDTLESSTEMIYSAEPITAASVRGPQEETATPLLDRPWFVLGQLFLETMALGLPFLWRSRGFTTRAKIVWSLLVTLYTVVILWGFVVIMIWCYETIRQSLA